MLISRRLLTALVALSVIFVAPQSASAEWWEFFGEMSGPGPFTSGYNKVGRVHILARIGLDGSEQSLGISSVRLWERGTKSRYQLRIDYGSRNGDRANDDTTVDWHALEVTLEGTWFKPRTEWLGVSDGGGDRVQFFSGAGVAFNRFTGNEFDDFSRPALKVTPAGVVLRDLVGIPRLGLEAAFNLQLISIEPADFALGPTEGFEGGTELLKGYYINLFIELF